MIGDLDNVSFILQKIAYSMLEQPYPRPLSSAPVENPPPSLVPARKELEGRFVLIEPQNADKHASSLYKSSHESEEALKIWDYLAYGPWPSEQAYFETIKNQSASFDPIFYSIRKKENDSVCGQASLMDIHAQNGVIEVGHIWFAPELQKTTAATEALHLLIDYAMTDLGYRRMQWRCNSMNEGSRAAARRLGFRFEGIFYNHLIFKGKNRDTAWYSILDDEWPEVREIQRRWLHEDNFNADGSARIPLQEMIQVRSPSNRGGAEPNG